MNSLVRACCRGLVGMPVRLARPRPRDERLIDSIQDAGLPRARTTVELTALPHGVTGAPTTVVAEGVWRPPFTSLGMTSFVVRHPKATFLVDAAICADVHPRILARMPALVRLVVRPERPVHGMAGALAATGLAPGDIDFVLATHLHWDHVRGVRDLPSDTPVRLAEGELESMGAHPTSIGIVPGLLDDHDVQPYALDGPAVSTFTRSHDIFGDGSVVAVDLAGHTIGSAGVLLATPAGPVLLAGDAAWHRLQVDMLREKAPFPGELVDYDRDAAFAVLHRLHLARHTIDIVPGHDREAALRHTDATP